jgi:DNA-directed RNA polymerase specialized sigma24 family protein
MTDTLIAESDASLFAAVAAGLNGGRFASRVTDETVKAEALALVAPVRAEKRRLAARKRQATKAERDNAVRVQRAEWLRAWRDYSDADSSRVEEVFALFSAAPRRSAVRNIARYVLAGKRHDKGCAGESVGCMGCFTVPSDWRSVVRAYRDSARALRVVGDFALSRTDLSQDGRFYRSIQTHWHNYAGGRHNAIHGVTPDDILQDALLSAIESGDTIDGVPTFGPMYVHTRRATESAVYTYRRGHNNPLPFTVWTWADWEDWAHQNGADRAVRVFSTMPEWQAYDAAKAAHNAAQARQDAIAAEREADMATLDATRSALAALIGQGYTLRRIANMLGRTPEAIVSDMERTATADVRFI